MSIELKIPDVGESVQDVQIANWLKHEGDRVGEDEDIVELETDKASMELPAPADGVLKKILKREGDQVRVGVAIAIIDTEGENEPAATQQAEGRPASDEAPAADTSVPVTPSARRELHKHQLEADQVEASGKRLRREDVRRHVRERQDEPREGRDAAHTNDSPSEEVVPMSTIRRHIARRLVEAQQRAALLTTYNEIDMSAVIQLREEYGERFRNQHDVTLGFMSFFVKAAIDALKHFPEINAEVRGDDIVYRNYYHIGIAIGGGKGLVVPVLRRAERLSFAEIEQIIDDFASRARDNDIEPDEMEGGTFTISNGGVYGSLLSTPIVNPPQSGVLGMHVIEDRPVARQGEVVIRPMMYIALTYDHRIVDGREGVSFLKRIKQAVEDPARMLIEV